MSAMLNSRDFTLMYSEYFAELKLGHFASLAERIEGHRGNAVLKSLLDLSTPRWRHPVRARPGRSTPFVHLRRADSWSAAIRESILLGWQAPL